MLTMAIYLVLVLPIFIFSVGAQSQPRAIVHIGPHKTSSSRIQTTLASMTTELTKENFYWPTQKDGAPLGAKGISNFALALKRPQRSLQQEVVAMKSFIQSSLSLNRNIILSSEEFDRMNKEQVLALKNLLVGFNVTIVFVYREILEQLISLHFETNRFEHENVHFSTSFSGYLLSILDDVPLIVRPVDILNTYAEAFGHNNLRVIDLLGVNTVGLDVTHVLLCEVAGILCSHTTFPATNTNSAYSLISAQVFSFYKSYVERQNNGSCSFCGVVFKEYQQFVLRNQNHIAIHIPPHTTSTKLTMLVPYAQQVDTNLRTVYGPFILHGNQSANFLAMGRAQVQQLDPEHFIADYFWNDWIHSEYEKTLAEGRLCGCTRR